MVLAALALMLAGAPLGAQNLLTNSGFDTTSTGWSGGTWVASPDAAGNPLSGSLLVSATSGVIQTCARAQQCVPVTGGSAYLVRASIYLPGPRMGGGVAGVGVGWFSDGACSTFIGPAPAFPPIAMTTIGSWQLQSGSVTAPATAASAVVSLASCADPNVTLAANFDDIDFEKAASVPTLGLIGLAALLLIVAGTAVALLR